MLDSAQGRIQPDDLSAPPRGLSPHLLPMLLGATLLVALLFQLIPWELPPRPALEGPKTWAHARLTLSQSPRPLVLLGTSALWKALDATELQRGLPERRTVSLIVLGASPLPLLHDLALDEAFRGDVLIELYSPAEYDPRDRLRSRRASVAVHRRRPLGLLEARIEEFLGENLRIFAGQRSLFEGLRLWFGDAASRRRRRRWRPPLPPTATMGPQTPAEVEARRRQLEADLHAILVRGGRVVLLRPFLGPHHRAQFEESYPNALFWDGIAPRPCLTKIDAGVAEPLQSLEPPDGVHRLDEDAVVFTRWLAPLLTKALPTP